MRKFIKFFFIFLLAGLTNCRDVTLILVEIPENTPSGATIYVAGNFNYWDPGDPNFTFISGPDNLHYMTLPRGKGNIEFLLTRGDWTTEERGVCGQPIVKRKFNYGREDTLRLRIKSWEDLGPVECPEVTFITGKVPYNTPPEDTIFLTGNFNSWNPHDKNYMLRKIAPEQYAITIEKPGAIIEYKFTRGNWTSVETDELGTELPKRKFKFGKTDTAIVNIPGWSDLIPINLPTVTFLVKKLPDNTPENDDIYLVGSFNNWYPRDRNYVFKKQRNGTFYITLAEKEGEIEYKLTRGSWESVEGDKKGGKIPNREFNYGDADTVLLSVASWEDLD